MHHAVGYDIGRSFRTAHSGKEFFVKNIFEVSLRKLFDRQDIVGSPVFSGNSCHGKRGRFIVRMRFMSPHSHMYDRMEVKVISQDVGLIDTCMFRFPFIWGTGDGNPTPHIRIASSYADDGKWAVREPDEADMDVLRNKIKAYLDLFDSEDVGKDD